MVEKEIHLVQDFFFIMMQRNGTYIENVIKKILGKLIEKTFLLLLFFQPWEKFFDIITLHKDEESNASK